MTQETNTERFYRLQEEQLQHDREEASKAAQDFLQRAEALKQAAEELQRQADELINQVKNNGNSQ